MESSKGRKALVQKKRYIEMATRNPVNSQVEVGSLKCPIIYHGEIQTGCLPTYPGGLQEKPTSDSCRYMVQKWDVDVFISHDFEVGS